MADRLLPANLREALEAVTADQIRTASRRLTDGVDYDATHARDLARDIAHDIDLAMDRVLARDLGRVLALDFGPYYNRDIGRRFDLDLYLDLDLDLALDITLTLGSGSANILSPTIGLDLATQAHQRLSPEHYKQLHSYAEKHLSGSELGIGNLYFGLLVTHVWYPMCVAWAISETPSDQEPSEASRTANQPPDTIAEIVSITKTTEPVAEERAAIRRTAERLVLEADNLYQDGVWGHVLPIEADVHNTTKDLYGALNPVDPDREFSIPVVTGHMYVLAQRIADLQPDSEAKSQITEALEVLESHEAQTSENLDDVIDVAEHLRPEISADPPEWLEDQQAWTDFAEAANNDPKSFVAWQLGWFEPAGTDLAVAFHRLKMLWNNKAQIATEAGEAAAAHVPTIRTEVGHAVPFGGVGSILGGGAGLTFAIVTTATATATATTAIGTVAGGGLGVLMSFVFTVLATRFGPDSATKDLSSNGNESDS